MANLSSGSQGARAQASDDEIARLAFRYVVRHDDLGMDVNVSTSEDDSDESDASPHVLPVRLRRSADVVHDADDWALKHHIGNAARAGQGGAPDRGNAAGAPDGRLANEELADGSPVGVGLCIDHDMTLADTTAAPVQSMTFAVPAAVDVAVVIATGQRAPEPRQLPDEPCFVADSHDDGVTARKEAHRQTRRQASERESCLLAAASARLLAGRGGASTLQQQQRQQQRQQQQQQQQQRAATPMLQCGAAL